jgi:predicted nuclease of predicted toxin-antitoxin system
MKLLFDQNLSFKLCERLSDIFPNSSHVRLLGLERADDMTVWRRAATDGYTLVSLDYDFAEMAMVLGPPPKVIWLRHGNLPTKATENVLRRHVQMLHAFESGSEACLEIY